MRSGCGLNHLSLSKSVLDHYKVVSSSQSLILKPISGIGWMDGFDSEIARCNKESVLHFALSIPWMESPG